MLTILCETSLEPVWENATYGPGAVPRTPLTIQSITESAAPLNNLSPMCSKVTTPGRLWRPMLGDS
jgi:hypothetical protein